MGASNSPKLTPQKNSSINLSYQSNESSKDDSGAPPVASQMNSLGNSQSQETSCSSSNSNNMSNNINQINQTSNSQNKITHNNLKICSNINQTFGNENKNNSNQINSFEKITDGNVDINQGIGKQYETPLSSQKYITNTPENNIDINTGKNNQEETKKPTENIDINSSYHQKINEEEKIKETPNVDNNVGFQNKRNEEDKKYFTNQGNDNYYLDKPNKKEYDNNSEETTKGYSKVDINQVQNKDIGIINEIFTRQDNEDSENPYQKEDKSKSGTLTKTNNYKDLDVNDPQDIAILKAHVTQRIDEQQLFPIFLKLKDEKPLYFCVNYDSTLRSILDYNDLSKGIKNENTPLYYKNNKISKDIPIKNLDLPNFAIITTYLE